MNTAPNYRGRSSAQFNEAAREDHPAALHSNAPITAVSSDPLAAANLLRLSPYGTVRKMPVSPGFRALMLDLLAPLHPSARRMFGGVGIMRNGVMFALLSHDEMYFRVDEATRPRYEAAGCAPFGYSRAGRDVVIASYYAVPETLYDAPEQLLDWAKQAIAAAERTHRQSKPGRVRSLTRAQRPR